MTTRRPIVQLMDEVYALLGSPPLAPSKLRELELWVEMVQEEAHEDGARARPPVKVDESAVYGSDAYKRVCAERDNLAKTVSEFARTFDMAKFHQMHAAATDALIPF